MVNSEAIQNERSFANISATETKSQIKMATFRPQKSFHYKNLEKFKHPKSTLDELCSPKINAALHLKFSWWSKHREYEVV